MTPPSIISQKTYQHLISNGEAIGMKHGHPAIVIHPDSTVSKVWAKKPKLFSSSRFKPYAHRFVQNAKLLAERDVTVPTILDLQQVDGESIHVVHYKMLDGTSIRDLLATQPDQVNLERLAEYFYSLHEKGILFKAIHFGNVIQISDNNFGLIDFTSTKFFSGKIPLIRRAANLSTPLRYKEDTSKLQTSGVQKFIDLYLNCYNEREKDRQRLNKILNSLSPV
ncbi:hypothetical protein Rhal01_01656 [Rubritalea halochordaticola]|uniref:Toluene tolerance protein n=2 Tax=Rubritalea halochordaticola TaxID=714537 RepID=A0ABP9UYG1_9BACT